MPASRIGREATIFTPRAPREMFRSRHLSTCDDEERPESSLGYTRVTPLRLALDRAVRPGGAFLVLGALLRTEGFCALEAPFRAADAKLWGALCGCSVARSTGFFFGASAPSFGAGPLTFLGATVDLDVFPRVDLVLLRATGLGIALSSRLTELFLRPKASKMRPKTFPLLTSSRPISVRRAVALSKIAVSPGSVASNSLGLSLPLTTGPFVTFGASPLSTPTTSPAPASFKICGLVKY
ncbi:hypothetical protein AVEN_74446-1 [Araneus ventricosus]|uniref:Uncharacterized protein n=1 Tax=Araneus ventricosus TaxID=182803 RepID=A0A4Y2SYL6_ARAVE|nr:hypothetical protein AVEN_74446-1 [Araneus ventricosus]